jgi:hypothetical protein
MRSWRWPSLHDEALGVRDALLDVLDLLAQLHDLRVAIEDVLQQLLAAAALLLNALGERGALLGSQLASEVRGHLAASLAIRVEGPGELGRGVRPRATGRCRRRRRAARASSAPRPAWRPAPPSRRRAGPPAGTRSSQRRRGRRGPASAWRRAGRRTSAVESTDELPWCGLRTSERVARFYVSVPATVHDRLTAPAGSQGLPPASATRVVAPAGRRFSGKRNPRRPGHDTGLAASRLARTRRVCPLVAPSQRAPRTGTSAGRLGSRPR